MAILLDNGTYVKLALEDVYIDTLGVHVSSHSYKDKASRDEEKQRLAAIDAMNNKVYDYIQQISQKAVDIVLASGVDVSKPIVIEELPQEAQKLNSIIVGLQNDLNYIRMNTYIRDEKPDLKHLSQLEKLKEFGFKEDWFENPLLGATRLDVISGPYLKQDFTHKGMYSELKKTFIGQNYTDV